VAGDLDAYVTFGAGSYGKGGGRTLYIEGETKDVFESKWGSIQTRRYDFSFKHDSRSTEEWQPKEEDSAAHDPTFEDATFTKSVDMSTPDLLVALYVGAVFDWVDIWQKKAGTSRERTGGYFFKISLQTVNIKEVKWSAGDSGPPEETITLVYRGIRLEYLPQMATGALDKSASKTTSNPLATAGDDGEYLTLPTAKNKDQRGKNGAGVSSSDKADIVSQVLAELKKNNPSLRIK
jgi:type VI protein secretion system component Hcp